MKKFKLFALTALLAMGTNAFAVDEVIQRANLAFKVTKNATKEAPAEVRFLGMVTAPAKTDADGAIANQPDGTITIPATTWTMDTKGNKTSYNVTGIDAGWASYSEGTNVTTTLKKLVSEVVEKDAKGKVTSNLVATGCTALEEVVLPEGQTVLATDAFRGCTKLKTINLGNIVTFGDQSLMGTAIESIDLTKATSVGNWAFAGVTNVKTLTIPATLTKIGGKVFYNMYAAAVGSPGDADYVPAHGLEELVFNAYSDKDKGGFTTIPALFGGDKLLKKITITSTLATEIAAEAFKDADALETLDLSGCTALTTIGTEAFAASKAFKTVKLAGTKLTTIDAFDFANSKKTLEEITLPAEITTVGTKFQNCVALKEIDLSGTKVKTIDIEAFKIFGTVVDDEGKAIAPVLATVKLNAETSTIGAGAFMNHTALATIEGLNQEKLMSIGSYAFVGAALTTLDLSATKLTEIYPSTFADNASLTSIKLPAGITDIAVGAFANDAKVTSINLQDLKKLTELKPIFHEGVVGVDGPVGYGTDTPAKTIVNTKKEVGIALTSLTLPTEGKLTTIAPGALQLLDITEIDIPATVTEVAAYALQGCINLEKFSWNEAPQRYIANNTFRGDDKLKEVKMVTTLYGGTGITIDPADPIDLIFKGNKKDVLKFIVNAEDYNALVAAGWTEANLKYCTLTTEGASVFKFKDAGKSGEYYYATYYNGAQATWFPAEDFEVFGAVVEGSNVVMKPYTIEGGYYKVKKSDTTADLVTGDFCVVRSKKQEADYELKNATFNNISTAPIDNDLKVAKEKFTPSRLKYQYKFGSKNGVVAFYRVTSGTIKEGGVYIEASTAAARLNIVFEGEGDATAIEAIANEAENSGAIYNLNGVRVNKAQKGVFIQNGKKFVVK